MRTSSTIPTRRTRVKRLPDRGAYDRKQIDAILDAGLVCHLGFVQDGQPYVIPTLHARVGDRLYVHGSSASRTLRELAAGIPACATVTLLDGIVLARSVFEHSVNYRSVVLLATAKPVTNTEEKTCALEAFTEKLLPGRWWDVRQPSAKELKATSILWMSLAEASAKVRTGGPHDADTPDGELDVWAGTIPLRVAADAPIPDPDLRAGIPVPAYAQRFHRSGLTH